jgi:hypothetical protein
MLVGSLVVRVADDRLFLRNFGPYWITVIKLCVIITVDMILLLRVFLSCIYTSIMAGWLVIICRWGMLSLMV